MSQRQLLVKRIGLVAITNVLLELNSLIMLPLLTKNLPASEYGVWVQISVTIGLVPAIALFGLPYSMVRFLPSARGRDDIREIFYSMAAIIALAGLVAAIVIYLFSGSIASALFDGRQNIVQILSLLVFLECLISIPFAYFRSIQQIKKFSLFNLSKVSLSLLLVIYFVLSGRGIMGALIGMLCADILIFLTMSLMVVHDLGASFPAFKNIKEYIAFGMPIIPSNLSSWIVNSSNRYVIGLLMGTTYVAYFSPGYTLGNMINLFIAPLAFILPATLAKHYDENDVQEVRAILGFSLKIFLALGIPAAFGLSILSRPMLNVLSTPEIAAQGYIITPFMALGALFLGTYAIFAQIMTLEKNTALIGKIWIAAAILNLISSFVLVIYTGIIGGAIATLISFAFACMTTIYYSNKLIKISFSPDLVAKSVVASIIMSLLLLILKLEGGAGLVMSVAIGAIIYFVVLFILKGFTEEEIAFFRALRYDVES